ncbi:hypothetical protein SDC9_203587 [bioreactor metagenome]|uniref:Uncharacterized protein n=1 Tax=bioreactor metagenome TaxID=1076179 RepID=A0A645J8S5_9ZZZZ
MDRVDGGDSDDRVQHGGKRGDEKAHRHGANVHGLRKKIDVPAPGEPGRQKRAEPFFPEGAHEEKNDRCENVREIEADQCSPQGAPNHGPTSFALFGRD